MTLPKTVNETERAHYIRFKLLLEKAKQLPTSSAERESAHLEAHNEFSLGFSERISHLQRDAHETIDIALSEKLIVKNLSGLDQAELKRLQDKNIAGARELLRYQIDCLIQLMRELHANWQEETKKNAKSTYQLQRLQDL